MKWLNQPFIGYLTMKKHVSAEISGQQFHQKILSCLSFVKID